MKLLLAFLFSIILIFGVGQAYAETEKDIVYFDMNENPELVKQKVSRCILGKSNQYTSDVSTGGNHSSHSFHSVET